MLHIDHFQCKTMLSDKQAGRNWSHYRNLLSPMKYSHSIVIGIRKSFQATNLCKLFFVKGNVQQKLLIICQPICATKDNEP